MQRRLLVPVLWAMVSISAWASPAPLWNGAPTAVANSATQRSHTSIYASPSATQTFAEVAVSAAALNDQKALPHARLAQQARLPSEPSSVPTATPAPDPTDRPQPTHRLPSSTQRPQAEQSPENDPTDTPDATPPPTPEPTAKATPSDEPSPKPKPDPTPEPTPSESPSPRPTPDPTPPPTNHSGPSHFWYPALGIDAHWSWYGCAYGGGPNGLGAGVHRWGCAPTSNIYLLAHAWSTFKKIRTAFHSGAMQVGQSVWYTNAQGDVTEFQVKWIRRVSVDYLNHTAGSWATVASSTPIMTLQTCDGSQSQLRIIVRLVAVN